ncbi:MAG: hypothetical protein LBQ77_08055 [Treponema sp.]|jgi:hypothetical protein|nr:hypothetical protein [Treponema sp.]
MKKSLYLGIVTLIVAMTVIVTGCSEDDPEPAPSVTLTLSNPVWSADTSNKNNVNELLARLWSANASSTVQGFTQGQVFAYAESTKTLTITRANITDSLKTWITTQWGGTSVPVEVVAKAGDTVYTLKDVTADANWSGAQLVWIDLASTSFTSPVNLTFNDGVTVEYTVVAQ